MVTFWTTVHPNQLQCIINSLEIIYRENFFYVADYNERLYKSHLHKHPTYRYGLWLFQKSILARLLHSVWNVYTEKYTCLLFPKYTVRIQYNDRMRRCVDALPVLCPNIFVQVYLTNKSFSKKKKKLKLTISKILPSVIFMSITT